MNEKIVLKKLELTTIVVLLCSGLQIGGPRNEVMHHGVHPACRIHQPCTKALEAHYKRLHMDIFINPAVKPTLNYAPNIYIYFAVCDNPTL